MNPSSSEKWQGDRLCPPFCAQCSDPEAGQLASSAFYACPGCGHAGMPSTTQSHHKHTCMSPAEVSTCPVFSQPSGKQYKPAAGSRGPGLLGLMASLAHHLAVWLCLARPPQSRERQRLGYLPPCRSLST